MESSLENYASVSSLEEVRRLTGREEAVVVTDDGSTIVCWHPETPVPYECTKPLPEVAAESPSILKTQDNDALKKLFSRKHPFYVNKELRELTFTTKHRWFPNNEKRFAKKLPMDRKYL